MYNDEEYVEASGDLDDAVWKLRDNDISEDEIIKLVEDAFLSWEPS